MKKLTDMTVKEFSQVLASDASAPGGGSASALVGSIGIALADMVAALTIGKKKYADHEELMKKISEQAGAMRAELIELIDKDTEAFNTVSAVFEMPKETDDDKKARKAAMQAALKKSTLTPFEMMTTALAALQVAEQMLGKSNTNAASDLGVCALCLKASVQGAWLNVLINISGIDDQEFTDKYRQNGEKILAQAQVLADKIYGSVLGMI